MTKNYSAYIELKLREKAEVLVIEKCISFFEALKIVTEARKKSNSALEKRPKTNMKSNSRRAKPETKKKNKINNKAKKATRKPKKKGTGKIPRFGLRVTHVERKPLSEGQQRIARRGFAEGSKGGGSNVRKVTKA